MPGDHHELQLLIVDPDVAVTARLRQAVRRDAQVTACREFPEARIRVLYEPADVLVTNLRLAEYNGLHLVILARTADTVARCIVHTNTADLLLIREAQSFGAFYERTDRLPYALPSYLHTDEWPSSDRRDPARVDRRIVFRGGRRAADVPELRIASPV